MHKSGARMRLHEGIPQGWSNRGKSLICRIVCLFDVESGARKRLYTEVPQGWSNPEKSFICRIVCLFDVVSGATTRYRKNGQTMKNVFL